MASPTWFGGHLGECSDPRFPDIGNPVVFYISGLGAADGVYCLDGMHRGKPKYVHAAQGMLLYWVRDSMGERWKISHSVDTFGLAACWDSAGLPDQCSEPWQIWCDGTMISNTSDAQVVAMSTLDLAKRACFLEARLSEARKDQNALAARLGHAESTLAQHAVRAADASADEQLARELFQRRIEIEVEARFVDAKTHVLEARTGKVEAKYDEVEAKYDEVEARYGEVEVAQAELAYESRAIEQQLTDMTRAAEEQMVQLGRHSEARVDEAEAAVARCRCLEAELVDERAEEAEVAVARCRSLEEELVERHRVAEERMSEVEVKDSKAHQEAEERMSEVEANQSKAHRVAEERMSEVEAQESKAAANHAVFEQRRTSALSALSSFRSTRSPGATGSSSSPLGFSPLRRRASVS